MARASVAMGLLLVISCGIAEPDDDDDDDAGVGGVATDGGAPFSSGGRATGGAAAGAGGRLDASGGQGGLANRGGAATGGGAGGAGDGEGGAAGHGGSNAGQAGETFGGAGAGGVPALGGSTSGGVSNTGGKSEPAAPPEISCRDSLGGGGAGAGGGASAGNGGGPWVRTLLGKDVEPRAINDRGQVVATRGCQVFLYDGSGVHELVVPGEPGCTQAVDINGNGVVLGLVQSVTIAPGLVETLAAFLWEEGAVTWISGVEGVPISLNDRNQVLFDAGWLWEAGQLTELTNSEGVRLSGFGLNNLGQVIAQSPDGHGYLWQAGVASVIPMHPHAINDRGHVAGTLEAGAAGGTSGGVGIWDGSAFNAFPEELDIDRISALNDADEAVGNVSRFFGYDSAPFAYVDGRFPSFAARGSAHDINDRGEAVGMSWVSRTTLTGSVSAVSRSSVQGVLWSRECPLLCCP